MHPGNSYPGFFTFMNRSELPSQFSATPLNSLSAAQPSFPSSLPLEHPSAATTKTYLLHPDEDEGDGYGDLNSGQETDSDVNAAVSNDDVNTCYTSHERC